MLQYSRYSSALFRIANRLLASSLPRMATLVTEQVLPAKTDGEPLPADLLSRKRAAGHGSNWPAALGYRMPGEWEPHEACWMGWPERPDNWANDALPAQLAWVEVASAISMFEPVTVCATADQWENARKLLPPQIRVVELSMDDAWFRDTGPTFVTRDLQNGSRQVAGIDWQFNCWGGIEEGCYLHWENDSLVAWKILELLRIPRFESKIVLEGGSIHVDGEGTLLTTAECLLNRNRNPNLTQKEIEEHLQNFLGVTKIIWLPRGLYGDRDTDGHVDNIACFGRPGLILLAWTDDKYDPQYAISKEAYEVLSACTDAKGRNFEIVKLTIPRPQFYEEKEIDTLEPMEGQELRFRIIGKRLAASYVNFYIANGAVIVPQFGDPEMDPAAILTIQKVFPDRKVVPIVCGRDILLGGGNIHCITQQLPAVI